MRLCVCLSMLYAGAKEPHRIKRTHQVGNFEDDRHVINLDRTVFDATSS